MHVRLHSLEGYLLELLCLGVGHSVSGVALAMAMADAEAGREEEKKTKKGGLRTMPFILGES